jgi:iron complex transport system substrate-binding protein
MAIWLAPLLLCVSGPVWLGPKPGEVRRIVSLAPSTTEILCAIDACELVVGVTRYDERPPAVAALPRVGGFNDPDPEAVVALRPDLVVAVPTAGGRARVDTLARLAVPVLVMPGESLEDLWVAIDALGKATNRVREAHDLDLRLHRELATIGDRQRNARTLKVLVLVGRRPLVAVGHGAFLDSLLGLVHAENVIQRGGTFPIIDLEALAGLGPDVIVDAAFGEAPEFAEFWARARGAGALAHARVVELTDDALLRPGPRLPAGLEILARALRPESP